MDLYEINPIERTRKFTIDGPVKEIYGFLVETFASIVIESTFAPPIDGLVMEKNGFLVETSPRKRQEKEEKNRK